MNAAKFVDQNTAADIIDINMGCPVPKVTKTDAGAHWLLDPEKVYEMVAAVTDAVSKPVTVKMRTGWDEDHIYAVQNALAAERGGAAALAMHGRTRKQLYDLHGEHQAVREFRMQAAYYLKGIPRSAKTKAAVNMVDTQAEVNHIFDDFVAQTEARARQRQGSH